MKLTASLLTFALIILAAISIQAQPDYLVTAKNGTLTDDFNFEFDIYIQRLGGTPLELAGFQTSIYFNDAIRNGGTLIGMYVPGTSDLTAAETPNPPNLLYLSSGGVVHQFRVAPKVPPGTGNGSVISTTAPGTRFGRFKITNTVAFNKTAAVNWQWNFTSGTEDYSSYINAYMTAVNTNITAPVKYQMELPDPLLPDITFVLTVLIQNGWNMVSIPGLHPTNQNVTTWWINKDPAAGVFKFQSGYQAVSTVVPGTGYWMKHLGTQTYNTGDEWPAGGIQIVSHDPIAAASGWNLFGGYEQTIQSANLTTTPGGLITGSVYKYQGGYVAATTIDPGFGYWVKLTAAGSINIPNPGPAKYVSDGTEKFGRIILTDNSAKSYVLYAAESGADLNKYELPPLPPQGMFDIRFGSGRFVENISTGSQTIELSGVQYPVKIKTDKVSIILMDETGKEIARLKAGEEFLLPNYNSKILVAENVIPEKYSLEQNYPNPFNPSTTIEFSLPEASKNVRVTVYNTLGQKVAELFNGTLEAGKYSYRWEASAAASGTYIYELRTDNFVSARKMVLLR